jgi:hypothetical protein
MNLRIGQKVLYKGEEWEIFLYMNGRYSIWRRENGFSVSVREDEIIGL